MDLFFMRRGNRPTKQAIFKVLLKPTDLNMIEAISY